METTWSALEAIGVFFLIVYKDSDLLGIAQN